MLDSAGASATAQLLLLLVQRFSLASTVSLFPGESLGGDADEAAAAAAAAQAVASNATLQQQLAAAFNASLAPALQPLQLNVSAATTSNAAVGSASLAGAAPEAAVAAAGAAQLLARRRRLAQAPGPAPTPAESAQALQLSFALEALSPNPLLYAGSTAPAVPAAAAAQLQLKSVDAAFADSLQQSGAATCSALAAVLAANPATAALLQGASGTFACSPPVQAGSVQVTTPPVSFEAFSWLPGERCMVADGAHRLPL